MQKGKSKIPHHFSKAKHIHIQMVHQEKKPSMTKAAAARK
jgi:hypothetical protein